MSSLAERAKEYGAQFKDAPETPEVSRSCAWIVGYRQALEDAAKEADRIAGDAVNFKERYYRKLAGHLALIFRSMK